MALKSANSVKWVSVHTVLSYCGSCSLDIQYHNFCLKVVLLIQCILGFTIQYEHKYWMMNHMVAHLLFKNYFSWNYPWSFLYITQKVLVSNFFIFLNKPCHSFIPTAWAVKTYCLNPLFNLYKTRAIFGLGFQYFIALRKALIKRKHIPQFLQRNFA